MWIGLVSPEPEDTVFARISLLAGWPSVPEARRHVFARINFLAERQEGTLGTAPYLGSVAFTEFANSAYVKTSRSVVLRPGVGAGVRISGRWHVTCASSGPTPFSMIHGNKRSP